MARRANPEYKPLLYTTTMRNPGRLKFMLYVLNKFEGQILNDELATKICGETIRYGLYRPMKKLLSVQEKWASTSNGEFSEYMLNDEEVKLMLRNNPQHHGEAGFSYGWPSRFATIYDLTKELGLAYYWPGEPIVISSLAHHLLKSFDIEIEPESGFVTTEISHPEYEQQVFLQAMAKSQRRNPFVRVLNDNIPLILLLETIQKINADPRFNGCGMSRRELPLLIFWKDNNSETLYQRIVELPDEFIRKMRMTGLLSLRGAGRFIDINKNEIEKVEYILSHYSHYHHFDDERSYFNYMAELDANLIKITSRQPSSTASEKLLDNWLSIYNWNIIKKELTNLATKKNSTDNVLKLLAAPTRLEFLTALAIRCRMPEVRVVPNYSCDDEGLPTSTAGGNKGDIECYEQQNGVLVEVTMALGRTQTMMEVWPIERHLSDFQKRQKSQCIFVAPSIYSDSERQIQFITFNSKGEKKIRPYDIEHLLNFLENSPSLFEYTVASLFDSPRLMSRANELMKENKGIDIMTLSRRLQEDFGQEYGSMSVRQWYVVTREYVERQTMRYDIQDNEPVMWMAAEDAPWESK